MEVILLENIKTLGNKYEIKNVKDGYARNFLLPRGLVKIATDKSIKELESQKLIWEKGEQQIKTQLEILAKDLDEQEFRFQLKTGKKEEVFGSVNKEDVKKAVMAKIPNGDIEIDLPRPIKKLGEHQVKINLGKGVGTTIKINVIAL